MVLQVLLIEDDPGDAFIFREMLLDCGMVGGPAGSEEAVVCHVERLADGLRQVETGNFDVILVDLGLPDSQGVATVQQLAAKVKAVPIVVLTGVTDQQAGLAAVSAGAQDYLVKGQVSGEVLVRAMRYAIERKRIENDKEKVIAALQEALAKVKQLSGLLPICCACKKVRDDQGYWRQVESYLRDHSDLMFSHGICPECSRRLYPDIFTGDGDDKAAG